MDAIIVLIDKPVSVAAVATAAVHALLCEKPRSMEHVLLDFRAARAGRCAAQPEDGALACVLCAEQHRLALWQVPLRHRAPAAVESNKQRCAADGSHFMRGLTLLEWLPNDDVYAHHL
jgi:hypothetical protein